MQLFRNNNCEARSLLQFIQSYLLYEMAEIQENLYPTQDAYVGGCNNENNL